MTEKFFITNYDRNEILSLIREGFKKELMEYLNLREKEKANEKDFDILLSRREVVQLLKISIPSLHNYQKSGILKSYRIGKRVLFKKGEVLEALKTPIQYRRWNFK
jgi:predicted DNA-binding transcriptional regulator AlpA